MTGQKYVLYLVEWESCNSYSTADLIKECFNCRIADILPDGNVIIADPQAEHWLSDAEMSKFVDWHRAR